MTWAQLEVVNFHTLPRRHPTRGVAPAAVTSSWRSVRAIQKHLENERRSRLRGSHPNRSICGLWSLGEDVHRLQKPPQYRPTVQSHGYVWVNLPRRDAQNSDLHSSGGVFGDWNLGFQEGLSNYFRHNPIYWYFTVHFASPHHGSKSVQMKFGARPTSGSLSHSHGWQELRAAVRELQRQVKQARHAEGSRVDPRRVRVCSSHPRSGPAFLQGSPELAVGDRGAVRDGGRAVTVGVTCW